MEKGRSPVTDHVTDLSGKHQVVLLEAPAHGVSPGGEVVDVDLQMAPALHQVASRPVAPLCAALDHVRERDVGVDVDQRVGDPRIELEEGGRRPGRWQAA